MSYFNSSVGVPPDRATLPAAYLAFGDTYAAEYERARSAGWPSLQPAGHHLHELVDPDAITAGLECLLSEVSYPSA